MLFSSSLQKVFFFVFLEAISFGQAKNCHPVGGVGCSESASTTKRSKSKDHTTKEGDSPVIESIKKIVVPTKRTTSHGMFPPFKLMHGFKETQRYSTEGHATNIHRKEDFKYENSMKNTHRETSGDSSESPSENNGGKAGIYALTVTIVFFVFAITLSYVTHQKRRRQKTKKNKTTQRQTSQSLSDLEEGPAFIPEEDDGGCVNPSFVIQSPSRTHGSLAMTVSQNSNDLSPPSYEESVQRALFQPPSYNEVTATTTDVSDNDSGSTGFDLDFDLD